MNKILTITAIPGTSLATSVALDPRYDLAIEHGDTSELIILIGDLDKISIDFVSEVATEVIGQERKVNIIASRDGDRLYELAESIRPSIIFLLLNNVFIHNHNFPVTDRIEAVIQVISDIRMKLDIPVIVYSGLDGYETKVRAAGVEHYFPVPFSLKDFSAAIRATIDKYHL